MTVIAENKTLSYKDILIKDLEKATEQYNEIYQSASLTGCMLSFVRKDAIRVIGEAEVFINSLAKYSKAFEKELVEIKLNKEQFKEKEEYALELQKIMEGMVKRVGISAASGITVVAFNSIKANWIATTFGKEAINMALSTLRKATKNNLLMMLLGGGILTTGTAGMVVGTAMLALTGPGGWIGAAASGVASLVRMFIEKNNETERIRKEIEGVKISICTLKEKEVEMSRLKVQTELLTKEIRKQIKRVKRLRNKEYCVLSERKKQQLGTFVNNVRTLSQQIMKEIE